jgi:tRNA pseudouridine65 synthase
MEPPQPLAILFQDEWIVAVDKPAGQLVHPGKNTEPTDEVTMKILRDQVGQHVYVLLFATDRNAARVMHLAFRESALQKIYWAIADGQPTDQQWLCHTPLQKEEDAIPQSAETEFRVLECLPDDLSLIEAKPRTGRYHQIRRHLLEAGQPIVGDYRYSGVERSNTLGLKLGTGTRMLLQAKSLQFQHPITHEDIFIEATVDPLIQKCRDR